MLIFIAFIYSAMKNKQHKRLCEEFFDVFGYYPDDIAAYEKGGALFTFQKDIHFLLSLMFKENSFFVRNINKDLYKFIRKQPQNKTYWIKVKFSLLLGGVIVLIIDYTIFYFL